MRFLPESLRKLLGRSGASIYVLDARGRLDWASPSLLRLLAAGDVGGMGSRAFDDLWARPGRRRIFLRRLAEADEVEDFERRLRGLDGEVVDVRESRYAHRDAQGRLAGHVGILQRVVPDEDEGDAAAMSGLTRDFATGAYGRDCLERLDTELGDRRCGCVLLDVAAARGELRPGDVRALAHLVTGATRVEDLLVSLEPERLALITRVRTLPGLKALAERVAARVGRETALRVTMRLAVRRPDEPVAELLERCRREPWARVESRHPRGLAAAVPVRASS